MGNTGVVRTIEVIRRSLDFVGGETTLRPKLGGFITYSDL